VQKPESIFNWLLGASVLSWAAFAMFDPSIKHPIAVRLSVVTLHLFVGVLILVRTKVQEHGSAKLLLMAVPAVIIGGWSFYLAGDEKADWDFWAQSLLSLGAVTTIISLCYLGRNFSILPAKRSIVTGGPYRIVRHPVYSSELIMLLGCAIASRSALGMSIFLAAVGLVGIRIVAEEQLLQTDSTYKAYAANVRWRLAPKIW